MRANHDFCRLMAANRVRAGRWGRPRRTFYGAAAPVAAPALKLARLVASLRGRGLWRTFARSSPVILMAFSWAGVGEGVGYLTGRGSDRAMLQLGGRRTPRGRVTPAVSVVVPAYHSDATIDGFLESLRAQAFRDFELVLVNSSPGDRTRAAVATGFPGATYVESEQRLLPHEARNIGVEYASAPLLAFTDPDCRARRDWLERHVAAQEAGHELTTGAMEVAPRRARSNGASTSASSGGRSPPEGMAQPGLLRARTLAIRGTYGRRQARSPTASAVMRGSAGRQQRRARPRGSCRPPSSSTGTSKKRQRHWRERVRRGREFGDVRARHEHWTKTRLAATALSLPVLPPLLVPVPALPLPALVGDPLSAVLPVQLLGQAAWCSARRRASRAWSSAAGAPDRTSTRIPERGRSGQRRNDRRNGRAPRRPGRPGRVRTPSLFAAVTSPFSRPTALSAGSQRRSSSTATASTSAVIASSRSSRRSSASGRTMLGDELLTRPRLSRIYYGGKFLDYPLRAKDVSAGWASSSRRSARSPTLAQPLRRHTRRRRSRTG